MFKTLTLRAALIFEVARGKFDHLPDLAEEVGRLRQVERSLRRSIATEENHERYFYNLWLSTASSHHRAQEMMVSEIDRLLQTAKGMLAQLEKHSVGKAQEWKAVLDRYRDGMSWLEQIEQFRESFVEPKHPTEIIEKLQKLREAAIPKPVV